MDVPTENALIYIAGFFDGEGSVSIRKSKPTGKSGDRSKNLRYSLLVVVTNTNLPILEYIQSVVGGVLSAKKRYPGARQCYNLYWPAAQGRRVLEALAPYLRVKKEDAGIGIAFQELMDMSGTTGNRYYSNLTQLDLDVREVLYQASKKLKQPVEITGEGE